MGFPSRSSVVVPRIVWKEYGLILIHFARCCERIKNSLQQILKIGYLCGSSDSFLYNISWRYFTKSYITDSVSLVFFHHFCLCLRHIASSENWLKTKNCDEKTNSLWFDFVHSENETTSSTASHWKKSLFLYIGVVELIWSQNKTLREWKPESYRKETCTGRLASSHSYIIDESHQIFVSYLFSSRIRFCDLYHSLAVFRFLYCRHCID